MCDAGWELKEEVPYNIYFVNLQKSKRDSTTIKLIC